MDSRYCRLSTKPDPRVASKPGCVVGMIHLTAWWVGEARMARRRTDPKVEALRQARTLNPRPESVVDAQFRAAEFFDARDLVQVKYEMLRRVLVDGHPVSATAAAFGFSRPSFYAAHAAWQAAGLPGLVPARPGPRAAHKLTPEVVTFLVAQQDQQPSMGTAALVDLLKERFGLRVHPRSVERALARHRKKG